ncbi:MAG: phage tail protein [Proteobacteria bacterium]|nr:phage tail protein [Pseudomonadota bacterium]
MNIDKFASNFVGGGIRPHLFQVSGAIGSDNSKRETQSFHIKSASLPASTLGKIDVPYRGRKIPIPGDRSFAEWQITVMCRGDLALRDSFEQWSNDINEHVDNLSGFGNSPDHQPLGNNSSYANPNVFKDWQISQLDRGGNVLKEYTFYGCWPSEIAAIALDADTNDTIAEFAVTLQYSYWTTEGINFKHSKHKKATG